MTNKLLREQLLDAAVAAAHLGIHEVGGNNHGPQVKKFLAEVGLPEGYAWCDAFASYEEHAVAGRRLPIESASVAQTYATARTLGWLVGPNMSRKLFPAAHGRDQRPQAGDLVLYDFDGDGRCDDHIGIVRKAVVIPRGFDLFTVEGNTESGAAGSQADGGGVYLRERRVSRASVAFVRIPESARASKAAPQKKNARKRTAAGGGSARTPKEA